MTERRRLNVEFATTQDIMDAADVSRRTVWLWIGRGLLPTPTMVSQGSPGGTFNRFPAEALPAARFIAAKRDEGLPLDEIKALLTAEAEARTSKPRRPAVSSRDVARSKGLPSPRRR